MSGATPLQAASGCLSAAVAANAAEVQHRRTVVPKAVAAQVHLAQGGVEAEQVCHGGDGACILQVAPRQPQRLQLQQACAEWLSRVRACS